KIRYELKKSNAYPSMVTMVRNMLQDDALRPDLYILLRAGQDTINHRQMVKDERERNESDFFRTRYYSALAEIHQDLGESKIEEVETDSHVEATLRSILEILERRKVIVT
ncbi:MAG TPA: hypothetical protein VJR06_07675, partial [Nitrososphaerales archaeon]|nr:hypothetical protein [Nitrososphaerales archaeon]